MDPVSFHVPRTDISEEATVHRPTPKSGTSFHEIVTRSASSIASGAESMVTRLPGGPVLAAAVRSNVTTGAVHAPVTSGNHPPMLPPNAASVVAGSSPSTSSAPSTPAATTPAEGPGGSTDPGASEAPSIEQTIAQSQDMNLYYLQLQEAMAAENRQYTAESNVLKARHDTVKNAIGNIR